MEGTLKLMNECMKIHCHKKLKSIICMRYWNVTVNVEVGGIGD
jgi:hypothetical protein